MVDEAEQRLGVVGKPRRLGTSRAGNIVQHAFGLVELRTTGVGQDGEPVLIVGGSELLDDLVVRAQCLAHGFPR